jgi:hypothetical protein
MSALPVWLTSQVPLAVSAAIDGRVVAFTLALSIATAVLFGLVPALQASRSDIRSVLTSSGDTRATGSGRIQSLLLVVETALALVLLIAATLLVQSLMRLQFVDPGFDTEHVLTFRVSLPRARYPETARRNAFFNDLTDRLRQLPGVTAAGGVNMSPLTDGIRATRSVSPTARRRPTARSRAPRHAWRHASTSARWASRS